MNKLSLANRIKIVSCLIEGNSIRATVRLTGIAKNTIVKLLRDLGEACLLYHDKTMQNLPCIRIQCDEIWCFCYSKQANVPKEKQGKFGYGDIWTWVAICPDTKLVASYLVGLRDLYYAKIFMEDLSRRLSHKIQLTTDGYKAYLEAVECAFGTNVNYSILKKLYGKNENITEARYSPSKCIGAKIKNICGQSNARASTSYVERQNLTMRMSMRRFTRLTNGFSKKVENLKYAVSLHFMYYNFCRIHQSLRVTPTMEAGITEHVWDIEELLKLID